MLLEYCHISISWTYHAKYSVLESIKGCISSIQQNRLLDIFFVYLLMNICVGIQLRHVFITTYHLRLQEKNSESSPDSNYWWLHIFTKKCLLIVNVTNFGFGWVTAVGLEWDLMCGGEMIDWMGKVTVWEVSEIILKCGSLWFGHSINHEEKPVGRTSLKRALLNRILLLVGFELLEEVRVKAYPYVEIQGWRVERKVMEMPFSFLVSHIEAVDETLGAVQTPKNRRQKEKV